MSERETSFAIKKVLLLIISIFCINAVLAYETVLVDFPQNENWQPIYYTSQNGEAILQYVPAGQNANQWTRTLIFHSYKGLQSTSSAAGLIDKLTMQMESKNSSQMYKYTKYTEMDSIATRCVQKNSLIPTQCEILRTSKSFEGLISMHYINKNTQDYKDNYNDWYNIIKNIRIYQSYYRTDRILDKATSFEL